MKKTISSFIYISVISSVFYFIIGWLVFSLILGPYTETNTTQISGFKKTTGFNMLFMYLSCLSYAGLIHFLLINSTIQTFGKAILFSSFIGVLIACMTDFYWHASSNFYLNNLVILLDVVGSALTVGLLGGVTYWLMNKK